MEPGTISVDTYNPSPHTVLVPTSTPKSAVLTPDDVANQRIAAIFDVLVGLTMLLCFVTGLALSACFIVLAINFIIVFLTAPLGIKDMAPPLGVVADLAHAYIWLALAATAALSGLGWGLNRVAGWAKNKTSHLPRPL